MRTKKLISFDFDDTLVKTPLPEEGKIVWKEVTGSDWKHKGWWSKPESLDMEVFDIPLNKHIYKDYKKILSDPENYIILATGRITALRNEVNNILDYYGLDFDEIHLNPGMDTFEFKKQLFENLIDNIQPEEFIMYDDRDEHLVKFVEWAKTLPCKTTIIDAKTGQVFEGNKDIKESIRRILKEETSMKPVLNNLLNMLFEGFDDIYYNWANYNCGMGECCDPYAIGFTLPKSHYDDYIFKLADSNKYDDDGDYPKELSDELPEVCYESPDVRNPNFDTIVFYDYYAEDIENYLGSESNWMLVLLDLINEKFHCNAKNIIII